MSRWAEVKVKIHPEAVEAVTALLLELGAGGVVVDDDEADAPFLVAYWPDDERLEGRLNDLRKGIAALAAHGLSPGPGTVETGWVEEEDWAHGWKAHFRPRPVGLRLLIRPTWDAEDASGEAPDAGRLTLFLDPGMAFGTGSHPTTRLCLELLERYVTPGITVADVGTGSGILAIAAALLGADRVIGVDVDPNAVHIARGNAAVNELGARVEFAAGSVGKAAELAGGPVPLVVANITAEVLEFLSEGLAGLVAPGGHLIVSGIVAPKMDMVISAFARFGLEERHRHREEDWIAAAFRAPEAGRR